MYLYIVFVQRGLGFKDALLGAVLPKPINTKSALICLRYVFKGVVPLLVHPVPKADGDERIRK